jgi:hypothetical protein
VVAAEVTRPPHQTTKGCPKRREGIVILINGNRGIAAPPGCPAAR